MQTEKKKTAKKELFVAYYRVSTKKQGLDMPAQKTAVKNYLKERWPPIKSFTEQESGKSTRNRPELIKALDYCFYNDATLLVAKLDRLSRDLGFIGWIQDTDIKFVCCDMPQATRETIGIMGVIGRWEREQISNRTKEALAEVKKKGKKLGYHRREVKAGVKRFWKAYRKEKRRLQKSQPKLQAKKKKKEADNKITKVQKADERVVNIIKILRSRKNTFQQITDTLNQQGIPSRFGGRWHKTSVLRVADRNNLE